MTNTTSNIKENLLHNQLMGAILNSPDEVESILTACENAGVLADVLQRGDDNALIRTLRRYSEDGKDASVRYSILNACTKAGVLKEILQHQDEYGENALMIAAYNNPEAVEPIMDACKKLDSSEKVVVLQQYNKFGQNALMTAVWYHPEVVQPILDACVEAGILKKVLQQKLKFGTGENVLMIAANRHPEVVKPVLNACKKEGFLLEVLQQSDPLGKNALIDATHNDPEAVKPILDACVGAGVLLEVLQQGGPSGENALICTIHNYPYPEAVKPIFLNAFVKAGVLKQLLQQKYKDGENTLMRAVRIYPKAVKPILDACENAGILADILLQKDNENDATVFEFTTKHQPTIIPELVDAVVSTKELTPHQKLDFVSKYTNKTPARTKDYLNWEIKLDKFITDLSGMKLNIERKGAVSKLKALYETYQGSNKKQDDLNAFYKDSVTLLSKILREDKKATIHGAQINRDDERTWSQFILLVVACLFVITIPIIAIADCCLADPSKAGFFSSQSQYRRTLTQYRDTIGATTQGAPVAEDGTSVSEDSPPKSSVPSTK